MATATSYTKAEAANQDIDKVVKAGIASSTNRISTRIAQQAAGLLLNDTPIDVGSILQISLLPTITKSMAIANLLGQRRALKNLGVSTVLSLDRFSEIRRLLEGKEVLQELTRLQKGYARDIYQDLYQIGSKVDAKIRFAVSQVAARTRDKRRGLQEIKKALRAIGYDKTNAFQIKTLYETAITRAYGKGQWDRYNSPRVWNLFWGYEYVTMRDDRVRPAHRALDGATLPKDDPFWVTYWPPNGWNCRCIVVPITKRRKQYRPRNPPPPDEGFEIKSFTNDYNPLNLSSVDTLYLGRGCCNVEQNTNLITQ